ncbi:MAG: hypothetical protein MK160_01170 [Rhodobacteraceae bacterium]|nr:hypothetical protein [Paracoccaceae bacterium]
MDLINNDLRIQQLISADTSAAPSEIYQVFSDGSAEFIYGNELLPTRKRDITFQDLPDSKEHDAFMAGCKNDQFASLYTVGEKSQLFTFVWSPDVARSVSYSHISEELQVLCIHDSVLDPDEVLKRTTVIVKRDDSTAFPVLQSWLNAHVQARTY